MHWLIISLPLPLPLSLSCLSRSLSPISSCFNGGEVQKSGTSHPPRSRELSSCPSYGNRDTMLRWHARLSSQQTRKSISLHYACNLHRRNLNIVYISRDKLGVLPRCCFTSHYFACCFPIAQITMGATVASVRARQTAATTRTALFSTASTQALGV